MEKLKTYIALFRGINVGGKNSIKMAVLKEALQNSLFIDAQTYIQSGNLIFKSTQNNTKILASTLESLVQKTFGHTISILVLSKKSFKNRISNNPFLPIEEAHFSKMYVSYVIDEISIDLIEKFAKKTLSDDKFHITKKTIYTLYENKYSASKLNNNFYEKKLQCKATTRNWKTSLKLLEMVNNS
ncbi:MAG: hypothetical protein COB60_08560 [Flavobacteriaceae bacterium]|nr:MAG: hypothetical protein COB60_08560 [Flavobacteriaceae bacterium]